MVREVKKILVLGLGVMGNGIAHSAAMAGYHVNTYDIKQEFVDKGIETIQKNLTRGIKKGKITEEGVTEVLSRVKGFIDLVEASRDVDFVIEAVFENIEVKINLYSELDKLLSEDVIIASNTSTLSISLLAGGSNRESRFIGMHFFNPVPMMKLCEIITGIGTSDETLELTKAIGTKMGKEVVVAKDSPGFIVNRILIPMMNEAVFALDEGVGSVEDIDKAIKLGLGHPMGPLTLLDLIGLDTALHVHDAFHAAFNDSKYRVSPLLRRMVASGRLGRKNGKGFYDY
ncbi:MAG: putative 3-hydroxybutyryl-CoA dehydrogenase [Candidatus Heimdallarchaeota archaeon LC_2]|nr:MAG: putative 3-hydroxybutyryl-CoA dehydrogenase [Candidatus Heimdallarchaeota archaeon LC_2]